MTVAGGIKDGACANMQKCSDGDTLGGEPVPGSVQFALHHTNAPRRTI